MIRTMPTESGAEFDSTRKYRYSLWRVWDTSRPALAFCCLNPSTADEAKNDPTVTRCENRARDLGYGTLFVVNIFALRSTDPKALYAAKLDPTGDPYNLRAILEVASLSEFVVCAWGNHGNHKGRGSRVRLALWSECPQKMVALAVNSNGHPKHPLYVKKAAALRPYIYHQGFTS